MNEAEQLNLFEIEAEDALEIYGTPEIPFLVVESGGTKAEPIGETTEQDRLLTAFAQTMDSEHRSEDWEWQFRFYDNNPDSPYERFRLGVAGLLKQGLIAVEGRNETGKYYSLTNAGLLSLPRPAL
jgi:hypothetical protein